MPETLFCRQLLGVEYQISNPERISVGPETHRNCYTLLRASNHRKTYPNINPHTDANIKFIIADRKGACSIRGILNRVMTEREQNQTAIAYSQLLSSR